MFLVLAQSALTFPKSTMEAPQECVKFVQSHCINASSIFDGQSSYCLIFKDLFY